MAWLWGALVFPLAALSTILCGTVSIALAAFGQRSQRRQIAVARLWSRSLLFLGRVSVHVEGIEKIDREGRYVFASNHLSYVDTPVVFSNIPVQFRFLAKRGLFQIPFLGWHLKTAGHIPVDRDDPRSALRLLTRVAELIETRGISVLIFPEGGRTPDGTLRDFKDGASFIAIKAQAALVPLALIGTREVLPMGSALLRRGRVVVRVGDPIDTKGMTLKDRAALTETARERVAALLEH